MTTIKNSLACCALVLLYACSHPIDIVGQGDVISASGNRDCSLEDYLAGLENCSENQIIHEYTETYTATPRPDWQFRRWGNYCRSAVTNQCDFYVPASIVRNFWGASMPPLQAVFRSTINTGFTSLFMGNRFVDPFAENLLLHANNAGFGDHASAIFFAENDQGAPQALWDNASQRAAIQAVLNSGDIELVGMTFDPGYPGVDGYELWIDYALQEHPDTRFFITSPWNADPASVSSTEYEASYQATHEQIHSLIDSLRDLYPGVDFYCLPSGQSAIELHREFNAGNLPDVSALVGDASAAVFEDDMGNPGDILVVLGELVWLSAIYGVDLTNYSFDPGYTFDLKASAQAIVDGHEAKYNAPPEVDIDTDGDGIVDRLDPNPTGKPNILLIVADDLGYNDLAINNGNTQIDTPNMDQLAQEGVRFTRHYASSVCSPARGALLTGLYAERVGYIPNARGISPDLVTLPEQLQAEGYSTWHIGKWHIGDLERTAWPDYQGFDHWFGFLNQWYLAGVHVDGELQLADPRYEDPWLQGDTEPGQFYEGHLENILTARTIEVISDLHAAQAPWFVNLWFYAPHGPITPASEFAANYPDTDAGRFQALVNQLDHNIGLLLSHLDSIGAAQDTIVVVVSDNGGPNLFADNNAPYAGKKGTVTEGGLRTPLIIRWTDEAINGQVIADTVSIQDIYPTLLESIDTAVPQNLDGRSFLPFVQQPGSATGQSLFWEIGTESYGVLSADGRWRLYQPPSYGGVPSQPKLFDLDLDPSATQEQLPPPAAELAQLTQDYLSWYQDAHRVNTAYTAGPNGSGVLTGMDFLRTPGFGTYTFGVGIPHELDGQIANQANVWSLSRSGDTIMAQFVDIMLSGELSNSDSCHSIIISGNFQRQLATFSPPDSIQLTIYLDGVETQSVDVGGFLEVNDPSVETILGDPASATGIGIIAPPVLWNTALDSTTPFTVESFSQDLCGL